MIPLFKNKSNKQPSWFDSGNAYIQNRLLETRPHYLTAPAAIEVCNIAAEFNFYIKHYEAGILHEINGKKCYEPRDGWVNSYADIGKVESFEDAKRNNQIAFNLIKEDIANGHTAFSVKLNEF
ncbi:hypothetical protein [Psychrobacter sp. FDAARGOS_221]|uniref:hypothetical protein n=1 Tax=Psychrobacter sp. FDAARGOS_221 TaxID=1975705 RepID=UPI000BB571F0|nr:hypothetical protein [Psychrobacter sp. FDAARGOS_221]PNK59599.1 hypothetical protein A6J60_001005 [Psychrobacter sp. FDAARGOS_221]